MRLPLDENFNHQILDGLKLRILRSEQREYENQVVHIPL